MKLKKVEEHVEMAAESATFDVDVQDAPEGTMFIVKDGRLVPMPAP